MANSQTQRPWVPKQFPIQDEDWYNIIGGRTTNDVASFIFSQLLGPLPPNTIMHEAAAGQAPLANMALSTASPEALASLRLYISDINSAMLNFARMTVEQKHEFPAAQTQFVTLDACDLSAFEDDMFTLTALTFGLAIMPSPQKAAAEMYRTLKPGGTAVSAFWSQQPTGFSLTEAHYAMRAPGRKLKLEPPKESLDPEVMKGYMQSGGFEDVQMHFHTVLLDVPDVRKYVNGLWAVIGETKDGWKQEDEDNWDACVDKAVEILKKAKGVEDLGNGHVKVEMIAMVAVAKK